MFLIACPYCGPRDQSEFTYGGEAHRSRPADAELLSDEAWADFVFMRTNPKGAFAERWMHAAGCRRWFNVLRSTATDRIACTYRIGEAVADGEPEAPPTPSGERPGSGNDGVKVVADRADLGHTS